MLSTEGFELRYAAGYECIHIDTRYAMRHNYRAWRDPTDRHRWYLKRCTRGVQQYVATFRRP